MDAGPYSLSNRLGNGLHSWLAPQHGLPSAALRINSPRTTDQSELLASRPAFDLTFPFGSGLFGMMLLGIKEGCLVLGHSV
jgi:hypothetical protein